MIRLTPATLGNFGRSLRSPCVVAQPDCTAEIHELFRLVRGRGQTVSVRGAGRSYSEAALNTGGVVMETSRLVRITEWDSGTGIATVQPGVTLRDLWRKVLPDGWWPPVVSGTMHTTVGGCLAANIHGKNNFRLGTFGEHVVRFTAALPDGREISCSPEQNSDFFYAMIGSFGLLGVFTSVTLRLKRVASGLIDVCSFPVANLSEQLQALEEGARQHDYAVGWLDATVGGTSMGRGQVHVGSHLADGDDPDPVSGMTLEEQLLPNKILGVLPRRMVPHLMKPLIFNQGMRLLNSAKYYAGFRDKRYRQSHAAFHFLLDYVPDWEKSYGRGGLVQYQSFIPRETALGAFADMLAIGQRMRLPSYLAVVKRHRPDPFLVSYGVDGFSLALDFKITDKNRLRLGAMFREFDKVVLSAKGRFYLAKNVDTPRDVVSQSTDPSKVEVLKSMRVDADPECLLQSDLARRAFPR